MKENRAPILAVHPAVPLLQVALHLRDHLHQTDQVLADQVLADQVLADQVLADQVLAVHQVVLHHLHLRLGRLVQIANVAVKIFRLAVAHPIVVVQRVRYRRGVKPVIHAGFVPSR